MPTFGQYETAQRLFLSGVGGIYTLKSDDKKVIKVLQPPLGIWSDDRTQEEIDAFRLRAKTQRALAKTSSFWAPVHDTAALRAGTENSSGGGEVEASVVGGGERPPAGGAFAVLDRYERSAQSLIDGRVNVLNADLRHLFTAIIKGLLDLKKTGRPHGNLKPTNILLNQSADLAAAVVHLTDPAADGALTDTSAQKDVQDLGRILYHLVNLRPYDGGTVPRTRDWDDLGPDGEKWRHFCNALLDPHAPTDDRDFEKALPRIDTWRAKPKQSKAPMYAAASLGFLVVGGVAFYFFVRPMIWPPLKYDEALWVRFNLESAAWFKDFTDDMYVKGKPQWERFRLPDYPAPIADLLDKAGSLEDYEPGRVAGNVSANLDELILNPTEKARKQGPGPEATKKAVELMVAIEESLSPAKWPLLTRLKETADRYEKLGWTQPAEEIRETIKDAQPPEVPNLPKIESIKVVKERRAEHPVSIFKSVEKTVTSARNIRTIDDRWGRIEAQIPKLVTGDAGKVKLLTDLQKFAEDLPKTSATNLKSLATSFEQIEGLLARLATATNAPVDYVALGEDPAAKVEPTMEAYVAFTQVVPDYRIIPDTRKVKDWTSKLTGIKSEMIDVIAHDAPRDDAKLSEINANYTKLGADIEAVAGIRLIARNQSDLEKREELVEASLRQLHDDAENHPLYMTPKKFEDAVAREKAKFTEPAKFPAPLANAAKAVREAWSAGQAALVKTVAARTLEEYRRTHTQDDARFAALEKFYVDVDNTLPADNDADRVALLAAFPKDSPWSALAQKIVSDYRESALADLVKKLSAKPESPPALDDASYKSMRDATRADYDLTCRDALVVMREYATIEGRLNGLYLLAGEPARDDMSYWELYEKRTQPKSQVLSYAGLADAIKPVENRVTALHAVDTETNYATLAASARADVPEVALAAWRKLGGVPITEDQPALDDEKTAQEKLAEQFKKLADAGKLDAARVQTLSGELAAQKPSRWKRWADLVAAPDKIRHAIDLAGQFGVEITRQNNAPIYFYQQLFTLMDQANKSPAPAEADMNKSANEFLNVAKTLPPDIQDGATFKDLIKRMTEALDEKSAGTSDKGAGPQLAEWTVKKTDTTWTFNSPTAADKKYPQDYSLTFVKLSVNEADTLKTVFLCTTEMSTGLFADVLTKSGRLKDIDNDTITNSSDRHWFKLRPDATEIRANYGPSGWRIVEGAFTVNDNDKWLEQQSTTIDRNEFYPLNKIPRSPSAAFPIQLISPWSAVFAARLLGCRIETSEEWLKAYSLFETGQNLPKDIWNLRGGNPNAPSWESQQAHAIQNDARGLRYPDKGIFLRQNPKPPSGKDATPWIADDLAAKAPGRITPGKGPYQNNTLWFLGVDEESALQPSAGPLVMHHLVGNVAEYVLDGKDAIEVITDAKPDRKAVDALLAPHTRASDTGLAVIGGSSLSPPEMPFNQKIPLNLFLNPNGKVGHCDVGFRLAFTAPKQSIHEILKNLVLDMEAGRTLPGPRVKKGAANP